jgi:NAD+ diphosphatase
VNELDPLVMGQTVFDRAAHHRRDQAWLDAAWAKAKVLRISPKSTAPVYRDGAVRRLDLVESTALGEPPVDRWFLGLFDDVPYFAVRDEAPEVDDPGAPEWLGLRDFAGSGDPLDIDLLVTSVALTQWHQRHGRCALCGAETKIEQAGWTRRCPVDDSEHFPRTDPAVIMLIHDGGDRCLLGRGSVWPPGRYSTLAGFVEPGESLESAVAREVFEEVGVVVDDVRYVASQPWPFPSSLMLGFIAHADGASVVRPDKVEMAEAGWFTRAEVAKAADWTDATESVPSATSPAQPADGAGILAAIPPRLSISRYLIDTWLHGRAAD